MKYFLTETKVFMYCNFCGLKQTFEETVHNIELHITLHTLIMLGV